MTIVESEERTGRGKMGLILALSQSPSLTQFLPITGRPRPVETCFLENRIKLKGCR